MRLSIRLGDIGASLSLASSIFLLATTAYGFTGTEGAAFLELPVGARPAGLGGAYSALAEDAYAPVWNPAGLAFLQKAEVSGMHNEYVESTAYEFGSLAYPLAQRRGVGLSIQYFRPGTINGLDQNGTPIGDIGGSFASYSASIAQGFGERFALGVTGSWIRASIDDTSAQALAGTVGALYRPNNQWRWAAVIANAGQKLKFISTSDSLPLTYRVGGAYHPHRSWTFALEGSELNEVLSGHVGLEYETAAGFAVRTGFNSERTRALSTLAGMSFGLNMAIWGQDLSYTWIPLSDIGSSHLISLIYRFATRHEPSSDTHRLERPESTIDSENDEFKVDFP